VTRRASSGLSPRERSQRPVRLAPDIRQAVRRFVRILARSGCAPKAIESEVVDACQQVPRSWLASADRRSTDEMLHPIMLHVITLWFSEPEYLDARGHPRPLAARGSSLSIESLVRRVNRRLDVGEVLRFLESCRALKRTGSRFVPRERVIILRAPGYMRSTLGGLFGLLKTIEHNRWGSRRRPARLQLFSFNARFPVSAAAAFEKRLRNFANRLLLRADADMHRCELARRPGERTVRMGVGVYQFEGGSAPRQLRVRARRGRARARRGPG
jgi:hypothetical protein